MSPRSKRDYTEAVYLRYKKATHQQKSLILDEYCATCGCHRKHAIRKLRRFKHFTRPKAQKKGKPPIYQGVIIHKILKDIWLAANMPCSKRLKVILKIWLPGYVQLHGDNPEEAIKSLLTISPATIDRILKPVRADYKKRGLSTTKPGTLLRKQIPVKTNQWDESRPGFFEADTVAHCGDSTAGMYVNTLDFVDIATGWTEQRAIWGKGEKGVLEQIKDIENSLPFPLLGFDSDNGSEFLNYHLQRHFTDRKQPVDFTRSRAYHKNDNAHVEQKNWTHVRQWLGYDRLNNPDIVPLLNDLYCNEWKRFHNFFCPSVKLISKERIGSKTIKRHDGPKTPFQRIIESPFVPASVKLALAKQLETLNPFLLRKTMDEKLKKIFSINYTLG